MSSLLVTVLYKEPNKEPCITSCVVPIDHHLALEGARKKIEQAYGYKDNYRVIVTEISG